MRTASICLLLLALRLPAAADGARTEPAEPSAQHYQLEAVLDPLLHELHGKLHLTLENRSARALDALYFHLYLNAFRDERSVFMRESHGQLRGVEARGEGRIALSSLRVAGVELLASTERELVPGDFTQLKVPLGSAIQPGAQVEIDIVFEDKLPPIFARAGYDEDFFVVAQWFPKLAKLEPDGHFASFPYHGLGEFYADFADYELSVRTPANFVVGASGALQREQQQGAQIVRHYRAARVHDVAFVAAPDLLLSQQRMGAVQVNLLAPPGYARALEQHAALLRRGLAQYGAQYGPYPYPTLTFVLPPRGAEGAAGMEYPTLILGEGDWLALPGLPSLSGVAVTAHELAHQWFYGLLASDEVRHPVLDEGLSEWATLDLLRTLYGPSDPLLQPLAFERFDSERAVVLGHMSSTSPGLSAPEYTPREYGASVYGRAALALESIRRAHGKSRFEQALARYARENRFSHPTPAALGAAFDAVYGAGFAQRVLYPLLLQGETSAVRIVEASTAPEQRRYRTRVWARREGVPLPTWLCAYDLQGRELARRAWPAGSPSLRSEFDTARPVARVALDADRALLLDPDTRDQVWVFAQPPARHLLSQLIAALQAGLAWIGP